MDSLEDVGDRLDTTVDVLQTRFARLIAEQTNTNRKLMQRVQKLQDRLKKCGLPIDDEDDEEKFSATGSSMPAVN